MTYYKTPRVRTRPSAFSVIATLVNLAVIATAVLHTSII